MKAPIKRVQFMSKDILHLGTLISLDIEADRSNIVRLSRFVDITLDFLCEINQVFGCMYVLVYSVCLILQICLLNNQTSTKSLFRKGLRLSIKFFVSTKLEKIGKSFVHFRTGHFQLD